MERQHKLQMALVKRLLAFESNLRKCSTVNRTRNYLKGRLEALADLWMNFVKGDDELTVLHNGEPGFDYFDRNLYDENEELYNQIKAHIYDDLQDMEVDENSVHDAPAVATMQQFKLPSLHIPEFEGNYDSWRSFHDLYVAAVHNNTSIPSVHKLQYLRSRLKGAAAAVVENYAITETNYAPAWKAVLARYNNKRALVNTQLRILLNQPNASESAFGLRNLLDTTNKCLNSLSSLEIDVESWDAFTVFIVTQRLPSDTRALWEQSLSTDEIPSLEELSKFLERRFRTLEFIDEPKPQQSQSKSGAKKTQAFHVTNEKTVNRCKICSEPFHAVKTCPKLLAMSIEERIAAINKSNLCKNCFAFSHPTQNCRSRKCNICDKKHNSLLHLNSFNRTSVDTAQQQPRTVATSSEIVVAEIHQQPSDQRNHVNAHIALNETGAEILLATAVINVVTKNGKKYSLRALLDQGSQANFITDAAANKLELVRKKSTISVSGVAKAKSPNPMGTVECQIESRIDPSFAININALIMPSLTHCHPSQPIKVDSKPFCELTLADPTYDRPGNIDMILSADVVAQVMVNGLKRGRQPSPVAQKSRFGWILFGKAFSIAPPHQQQSTNCFLTTLESIDKTLRSFHEIEDRPADCAVNTQEDVACEEWYDKTCNRSDSGRYIVSLPFVDGTRPLLGKSRDIAISRLHQLERRFSRDESLKRRYIDSINKFIEKGFLKPTTTTEQQHAAKRADGSIGYSCCYLPHHGVVKESSLTTKLRTVFDASCVTSNGKSLNDTLLTGPVLQDKLINLLMRWRKWPIVFKADITQMYLQVQIAAEDADYQRIVWRENPHESIRDYKLNTVTFGTASAPYLAVRTLRQLACDEKTKFPIGAKVLTTDFYVDDLMSGADNEKDALVAQQQIIGILHSGGFEIRKWSSNSPIISQGVVEAEREICESVFDTIKTLGLNWNPITDNFVIKTNQIDCVVSTKRTLLSAASKLFDPLGWVAPTVIIAKILMQQLWLSGVTWDEPLPTTISSDWTRFQSDLHQLDKLSIPRWTGNTQNTTSQLHAFCDASERAYAATIYLRTETTDGRIITQLILAKTRVAPVKKISVAKLELCGALLGAQIINKIGQLLNVQHRTIWTDSQIVLAWIRGHPTKWKTFVANRVSEIHDLVSASAWHYVASKENPADCATRGLYPSELVNFSLWWEGPLWLKYSENNWPLNRKNSVPDTSEEGRRTTTLVAVIENNTIAELLERVSSLTKLLRVIAYCRRWRKNQQNCPAVDEPNHNSGRKYIRPTEIESAEKIVVKYIQNISFGKEIECLKKNVEIKGKNSIRNLNPFLDVDGIVRVGGRLQNSGKSYQEQHQILLPKNGKFTNLLIDRAHKQTKHGGPSMMLSYIRTTHWIMNARNSLRSHVHRCTICFRYSANGQTQLMGNLPGPRVTISRPFTHVGIDYAGPLEILAKRSRGRRQCTKGYICIFICLATKAIHLELVGDLTTQSFMASFSRFIARRGNPTNIYSDNGTNFVGAAHQLERDCGRIAPQVAELVANEGITWHFIPPSAPHFGGLWEAGVKSTKFHLRRILGNAVVTFEEMTTTLAEIEACLNSRPLCPLSNDPNDFGTLTPAHFLIGDQIRAPPRPSVFDINVNRLDRWQVTQQLTEQFWHRWSNEYLHRLQTRPKWLTKKPNILVGDMVLVREDRLPPAKWIMGRIVQTHAGQDDLVRSATVKTATTVIKRPITKLCRLPIEAAVEEIDIVSD